MKCENTAIETAENTFAVNEIFMEWRPDPAHSNQSNSVLW